MRVRNFLLGAAAASLLAGSAEAGVVLTDTFDAEAGGVSRLNYFGFANWNVTGQVDLLDSQDPNGVDCNGAGSCIDLDGTSGPGRITTKNSYHFNAGDTVAFNFDFSGNQRGGPADDFNFGFTFGEDTLMNNVMFLGNSAGIFIAPSLDGTLYGVFSSDAWRHATLSFVAGNSGNLHAYLGTPSSDTFGPVIDNVSLSIGGAVPEPGAWALMLTAFGLAGSALRRRRAISV